MQQMSKKEIEDLLRRGAYGAIMDEEDEGSKFCEEDIDQILMRRTKTITIESEGRGSTFAKVGTDDDLKDIIQHLEKGMSQVLKKIWRSMGNSWASGGGRGAGIGKGRTGGLHRIDGPQ